ncbi:hypothetical protein EH165_14370 [Nakamurella antarctica]|uniref:Carbon monoxide dehydrogenase subunit G n=1 Tax=Nakamurella antarctica TaxID=1902245 RepID=A0A3G8ZPK0_9ACTN|nr:SRPBCC family protein [Nakamurella antarctica]AZI59149.1 hypothetical protein EH165_14370 [Nakamurella antarctica]
MPPTTLIAISTPRLENTVELEHRFEVPQGIDKAWAALLNMELLAQSFPGAHLVSSSREEFLGSVKVKLGPAHLNYRGKATFVVKDNLTHRAQIEAAGAASRSGSTATMLVTATATAVAPNRTAVDLLTTLAITGRPAQVGRSAMMDVVSALIGQFADNFAKNLTGKEGSGATLVVAVNPDEVAAEVRAATRSDDELPVDTAHTLVLGAASQRGAATARAASMAATARPRRLASEGSDAISGLSEAGTPLLKQLVPLVGGVIAGALVVFALRSKKTE